MSEGNKNTPVDFGADSAAAAIAAAKKKRVPIGGVPMPDIRRFDLPPPDVAQAGIKAAQKILTPEEREKLIQNGQFHHGVGSGYAANQPAANRLPTDQEGKEVSIDPRLTPRPAGAGLRPETVKELEVVAAANSSKEDEELKKISKEIDDIDEVFETNEFGERVKSLLGNKARAKAIETRCSALSLEDLLINGTVTQKVPIVPGKFEPTFRSPQGFENLETLRMISDTRGSDDYVMDTLSLNRLVCGLFAINGRPLPNHLDNYGDFSEELFKAKKKIILKMALPILADLVVNFGWFQKRVQKLTVIDDIKTF